MPRGIARWLLLVWLGTGAAGAAEVPNGRSVREVLILHHSHLDVGFTHPQPMLWELQKDFLSQALDLLEETADGPEESLPRWTCEVTEPVTRWLATASRRDQERFQTMIRQGRLGISAWQFNTTPLCGAEGLARQLYQARQLRERFGARLNTAHGHDVTGLPWTVVDLLLDSQVELLTMGINLHLGGTPTPRPGIYRWRGPGGRELLVMNGEHYSMFDQWANTGKNSLEVMQSGLDTYLDHLEKMKYPHDFVYLTATCAPFAYDNSPPNPDLPKLVRQWNEQGRQPRLRFVTPQMLLERIQQIPRASLPVMTGDWTDYWNFGAASSAAETRLARQSTADLEVMDLLHALRPPEPRQTSLTQRIWELVHLYNEHTWGAAGSLNPDDPKTVTQWLLKGQLAHEAQALAEYGLVKDLQQWAGNPASFWGIQGVLVINPTHTPLRYHVPVPDLWRLAGKRIESGLMRGRDQWRARPTARLCGPVDLAPASWQIIPLSELKPVATNETLTAGPDFIESPTHRLVFDPVGARITGLWDKTRQWQVLDTNSPWGLFELAHEKPDPQGEPSRKAFHVRSVENERVGLTGWKTDWKAVYSGSREGMTCRVERTALTATLILTGQAEGLTNLEQRITLRTDSPGIELTARFIKADVRSPESLYFTFPVHLEENWRSHFDTAGVPTELDAEQLPGVCRDWVTVDTFVSVHQPGRGVTLYCPDAPLVQVGGFNFGRKQASIPRRPNPLLLAWPLNNYWETNFRASQPGPVVLRYVLATHGEWDPVQALAEGRQVMNPPLVHAVHRAPARQEGQGIKVKGEHLAVVYVKPAMDGQGLVVRLLNLGIAPEVAQISLPGRSLKAAWRCSTLEDNQESLAVQPAAASCPLAPRRITTIRLQW